MFELAKSIRKYLTEKEQERLFLFVPVFFAIGISIYFSLNTEPSYLVSFLIFSLLSCATIFHRIKTKDISYFLVSILLISAGFLAAHTKTIIIKAPIIESDLGTIWVRGTIDKIENKDYGKKITLSNVDLWQPDVKKFASDRTPKKIILHNRVKQPETFKTGDYIQTKAILNPPEKLPIFPESYDFGRTSYFNQVGGMGFTISPIKLLSEREVTFTEKLKHTLADKLFADGINDSNAITYAMITGDDTNISKSTKQVIRDAGLGHILAVSGLHMSIVMAGLFFMIRFFFAAIPRISLYYDVKKLAAFVVIIIGYYYLQLTGFPVSAERSYIMVVIFFMAMLFDRSNTTMRPLAIAAIILFAIKPEAIFDAGFQMSFAAVASLIFLYEVTKDKDETDKKLERKFKSSFLRRSFKYLFLLIISSLVAGLATTPYSIYHFGRYSNYSILANLIAIPVSTYLIMPACFLVFIFLNTGLFDFLAEVANITSIWLKDISVYSTSFPNPVIIKPFIPLSYVWLSTLIMCVMFFFQSRIKFYLAPVLIVLFYAIFTSHNLPDIIISKKNFAIRDENGDYHFSTTRKSFSNTIWQGKLALTESKSLKNFDSKECTSKNCIYNGFLISKQMPQTYDCSQITYLINLGTEAFCPEKTIINAQMLEENGTHLIRNRKGSLMMESVRDIEGKRPWNI